VSKNWAKKSSSAPFGDEKVKGLRGEEDEDEAVVKAEGAEFSTSRLKKSSTVGSNEKDGVVVIESVNILVGRCGRVALVLSSLR
jgi:hypothetical protein